MRRMIVECDGCGKSLEITEENIEKKTPIIYHKLQLNFRSFMKDPNTNQEEEVSNMARQTDNIYCNDCFLKLPEYMDQFISDVAKNEDDLIRAEKDPKIKEAQSLEPDGLDAIKGKN